MSVVTAFAILAMFSGSDLGKVCWVSKGWHLWKICKASQEADYSNCLKCTVRERSLWWRRLRYEEFWWSPSADFEGQIKGSNALWRKQGIREIKVCKKCPKVNPYCDAIFDQSVTVRNEPGNDKEQTSSGHRVMITWSFSLGPEWDQKERVTSKPFPNHD